MILKTLDLAEPSDPTFTDLEDETYACCASGDFSDFYLFGGDSKNVQKCFFGDANKNLTMLETKGNINHLHMAASIFFNQKFFAAACEDNKVCLYDFDRERSFFPKESDCHEASCIFTKISPRTDLVTSLAKDGSFCLYEIKQDEAKNLEAFDRLVLKKKFFFSNDLKAAESKLRFGCDFLTKDGDLEIIISGKETLQKLTLGKNNQWELSLVPDVTHSEKIVNVLTFNYNFEIELILTVSTDKKLKLWAYNAVTKANECVGSTEFDDHLQTITYCDIFDRILALDMTGNFYCFEKIGLKVKTAGNAPEPIPEKIQKNQTNQNQMDEEEIFPKKRLSKKRKMDLEELGEEEILQELGDMNFEELLLPNKPKTGKTLAERLAEVEAPDYGSQQDREKKMLQLIGAPKVKTNNGFVNLTKGSKAAETETFKALNDLVEQIGDAVLDEKMADDLGLGKKSDSSKMDKLTGKVKNNLLIGDDADDSGLLGYDPMVSGGTQMVGFDMAEKMKKFDLLEEKILNNESLNAQAAKKKSVLEKYTKVAPQNAFHPSSTEAKGQRCYLMWNLIGQIVSRTSIDAAFIDIYYNAGQIPKKLIQNTAGYTIAALNHDGYALASKGIQEDEDEYADEEISDDAKLARITFSDTSNLNEWTTSLKRNEAIEHLTMGCGWICASTSLSTLRIFSYAGIEVLAISFEKPIVCLAAHENLLAIVYHSSIPLLGHQSLQLRVYNILTYEIVIESPMPINVNSKLTWFGFSEEGLIYSQDSHGIVRTMMRDIWIPVWEESEGAQ